MNFETNRGSTHRLPAGTTYSAPSAQAGLLFWPWSYPPSHPSGPTTPANFEHLYRGLHAYSHHPGQQSSFINSTSPGNTDWTSVVPHAHAHSSMSSLALCGYPAESRPIGVFGTAAAAGPKISLGDLNRACLTTTASPTTGSVGTAGPSSPYTNAPHMPSSQMPVTIPDFYRTGYSPRERRDAENFCPRPRPIHPTYMEYKHGSQLVPSKGYKCKICHHICFSRHDLAKHNAFLHKQDPRPYRCEHCGRKFSTSAYLSQHRRIHMNIKPYACRFCDRRFTQLSHVQQHERIHTGEKPYKCWTCQKSFTQMSNLQSHQRQHMKDKPCRCDQCFMCYDTEEELDTHVQAKHSGNKYAKVLLCPICGRCYNSETYLTKHMLKHHDNATDEVDASSSSSTVFSSVVKQPAPTYSSYASLRIKAESMKNTAASWPCNETVSHNVNPNIVNDGTDIFYHRAGDNLNSITTYDHYSHAALPLFIEHQRHKISEADAATHDIQRPP